MNQSTSGVTISPGAAWRFKGLYASESLGASVYRDLMPTIWSRNHAVALRRRFRFTRRGQARYRAAGHRAAQVKRRKQERMGHRSPASTVMPSSTASAAGSRPRRGMACLAMS